MAKCHQNRNRCKKNAPREKTRHAEDAHRRKQMLPNPNWKSMILTNYLEPFSQHHTANKETRWTIK